MNRDYTFVSERAGGCCEYCKTPERFINFRLEVDHFIPVSAGGTNDRENLVFSCRSCNAYKAFHHLGFLDSNATTPLFNPRTHVWSEHFKLDVATAEIMALTNIGEGTIQRLRMNSETQLRARKFWLSRGESWI